MTQVFDQTTVTDDHHGSRTEPKVVSDWCQAEDIVSEARMLVLDLCNSRLFSGRYGDQGIRTVFAAPTRRMQGMTKAEAEAEISVELLIRRVSDDVEVEIRATTGDGDKLSMRSPYQGMRKLNLKASLISQPPLFRELKLKGGGAILRWTQPLHCS